MEFKAFDHINPINAFFEQIETSIDYRHYTQVVNLVYKGLSQLFEFEGEQYIYNYYFIDKIKKVIFYDVVAHNGELKELLVLQEPSGFIEVYENGCKTYEVFSISQKLKKDYPELCNQLH